MAFGADRIGSGDRSGGGLGRKVIAGPGRAGSATSYGPSSATGPGPKSGSYLGSGSGWGIVTTAEHWVHRAFLPANSSRARRVLPQPHTDEIAFDPAPLLQPSTHAPHG